MKLSNRMRLQFFAGEGDSTGAMDMAGLNNLLEGMGTETDATQQTTTAQPEPTTQETDTQAQQQTQQQTQQQSQPQQRTNQAEYAFAQMRVENTQYKNMLTKLAKATGIEFNNEKELIDKLNDQALESLSKRQNVPVEVLKRLETLEQTNQTYELEQRKSATLVAFQNLKNEYGLDDDGLLNFAQELDQQGLNPFVKDVDISGMYRQMHFEEIMNARIAQAVQDALSKSSVADTHGSTPNSATGSQDDGGKKITTVGELSALLDTMK